MRRKGRQRECDVKVCSRTERNDEHRDLGDHSCRFGQLWRDDYLKAVSVAAKTRQSERRQKAQLL